MNRLSEIICLALATLSVPAFAQSVEQKHIDKGKFEFDRESGYIYLHGSTRTVGRFLKVPTEEDIEKYQADWEEAFVKAQKKYAKRLKRWEKRVATAKKTGKRKPEQPVEPTRASFSIPPIEIRGVVSFGPQYVFSKSAKSEPKKFSYMNKVTPGTYVYYGPIVFDQSTGTVGTCFCMGTVQLEVKPGVITNLGNFLVAAPDYSGQSEFAIAEDLTVPNAFFSTKVRTSTTESSEDFSMPASLSSFPNEKAEFRAAGKMDNFYGISISRMAPIPGILGYDRDKVIDIKLEAEKEAARLAAAEAAAESATKAAEAVADTAENVEAETVTDEPEDGTVTPVNNGEIG